ncbi:MAG: glycosyltransferase family 39 protein [Planctomycetaceae bacterium]|nr:glycosyltransferase family 39 protein [Planctomycetaceae bacterium]
MSHPIRDSTMEGNEKPTPAQCSSAPSGAVNSNTAASNDYASQWRPLVVLLLVACFAVRLIAAVWVDRHVQTQGRRFLIEGDANGYWELAEKLAHNQEYAIHSPPRRVLRMPGFPFVLSLSIRLFGDRILPARILLALIGTGCCWLTYELARRMHMRRTGFWAAVYVGFHPLHVGNSVLILSETLFAFVMLAGLLFLLRLLDEPSTTISEHSCRADSKSSCGTVGGQRCRYRLMRDGFVVGCLTAVAVLVRPGFLPWLLVAMTAVWLLLNRSRALRMGICVLMATGCLLTLLPWAARNATVTGHWVFTSLWSGPSLYDSLNPSATGASNMAFFDDDNVMSRMSEFEMNEYYKRKAFDFVRQQPLRAAELAVIKSGRFLSPVPNEASLSNQVISTACAVSWVVLFGCAGFGAFFLRREAGLSTSSGRAWFWSAMVVTVGPLLLFLLVHMVFIGSVRYRLPAEFPLAALAAAGWRGILNHWSRTDATT